MFILVLVVFLSSLYRAIRFEGKIRTYSKKIEIGMKDDAVLRLLGLCTRLERDSNGRNIRFIYED